MKFCKMQGAGNDFILLDNRQQRLCPDRLSALAKRLCRRRFSVGADGLIALERSKQGDARMLFFNSDGSRSEFCGNGLRCFARYVCGLGDMESALVETDAGLLRCRRLGASLYSVEMPKINADREVLLPRKSGELQCRYIELGSPGIPHAVIFSPRLFGLPAAKLRPLARVIRQNAVFPKGANVNFCRPLAGGLAIAARTYERGVEDFTLACGSGAAACAHAFRQYHEGVKKLRVLEDGGSLTAEFPPDGSIWLTGGAEICYIGEAEI